MSYTICQRCNDETVEAWVIRQAELHVGRIEHWKVQLCRPCTLIVEQAVLAALKAVSK